MTWIGGLPPLEKWTKISPPRGLEDKFPNFHRWDMLGFCLWKDSLALVLFCWGGDVFFFFTSYPWYIHRLSHHHVVGTYFWEAHAPSVGKYGETNALEQPPQDRKHILWKNICAVWSSYNLVVDMLGSLFRIFLVAPMSNEGKNMTLNDFKEVVKQLFLYRSIALPNNKFFLIVHSFSHRKASLIFLTNTFPYYPLPSF